MLNINKLCQTRKFPITGDVKKSSLNVTGCVLSSISIFNGIETVLHSGDEILKNVFIGFSTVSFNILTNDISTGC